MKRFFGILALMYICAAGCKQTANSGPLVENKFNALWLQKIINNADTSYSKPYFGNDFVTASYYINRKDSTLCQVMRDSSKKVRQIIIVRKGIRTFYSQFYRNGQAIAILPLNKQGRFDGDAILFYADGAIKSKGKYYDGLYNGVWKIYNEKGKLISKEEYDNNGQLLKVSKY